MDMSRTIHAAYTHDVYTGCLVSEPGTILAGQRIYNRPVRALRTARRFSPARHSPPSSAGDPGRGSGARNPAAGPAGKGVVDLRVEPQQHLLALLRSPPGLGSAHWYRVPVFLAKHTRLRPAPRQEWAEVVLMKDIPLRVLGWGYRVMPACW